jgi:hypothetical protein
MASVCLQLVRLEASARVEEAKREETAAQVVQETEAVCGIDEETGLYGVCKSGRTGQSEY